MSQERLVVIAEIRAARGRESAVKELLLGLVPKTREETGCLQYDLHESEEEPGLFWFYEQWTSRAALDEHLRMPYIQEMVTQADILLAASPRIVLCRKLNGPGQPVPS